MEEETWQPCLTVSAPAHGALLNAAQAASPGQGPGWLTLSILVGWQSRGMSPWLSRALEALLGRDRP